MKNILLIITLFISWNAIAVDKTWYCIAAESVGLKYKDSLWKMTKFKLDRITVMQTNDYLKFSDNGPNFGPEKQCGLGGGNLVTCTDYSTIFTLNPETGLATSASTYGWLSKFGEDGKGKDGKFYDTLNTALWRCESF
jgi:hypothetical protein